MTSDNWSLKGKENITDMEIQGEKTCFNWFYAKHIETLRQLILSDIEKLYEDVELCKDMGSVPKYWITDCINKRFLGVDE